MRTVTMDPSELVVIRSYRFGYEAELARILLEATEIPCVLLPDTYTELGTSGVRLAVRRGDADDAVAVLDTPGIDVNSEDKPL